MAKPADITPHNPEKEHDQNQARYVDILFRSQNSELRNYLVDHILIYKILYNILMIMFT